MTGALRAELFATGRRPGVWTVGGVWIALTLAFGIAVPYIVYLAISGTDPSADALLGTLMPDRLVPTTLSLFPLFGSAVMLILGTVVAGGEHRWNTWGTLFTQGPSRPVVVLAKAAAMAVAVLWIVLATFLVVAMAGTVLALVEGQPVQWPGFGRLVAGLAAGWLVGLAAACLGFTLAILFRGMGPALGVGLVWLLALENAVNGLSYLLDVTLVQQLLLGPSAGALATALGATTQQQGGTPGVVAASTPLVAVTVLLAYIALTLTAATLITTRRDTPGLWRRMGGMGDPIAFLAVALVVIITPGQDTALTIRNTIAGGRRNGVLTAFGVVSGQLVWVLAACAGLTALLVAWQPGFLALKIVGAAYLVYLGLRALRDAITGRGGHAPGSVMRGAAYRQGALSNLGNPKMVVFFTSMLPQFAGDSPGFVDLLLPGLVFAALTTIWLSGYAVMVAAIGDVLRRPTIRRTLDAITGVALIALGIRLAATRS